MTLKNQEFDKRLVELTSKMADVQKEIEYVKKQKADYISGVANRKDSLIRNSVTLEEVSLEVIDGFYFIIAKDDTFEYVLRLTTEQAEVLADDLDHELGKQLNIKIETFSMVHDMFAPLFKKI